ncbi:hypothetical protein FJO69_01695 [[Mycoplasma] falconis]|uniref:Uncharacterized protein n=1 Tax=[Mycoplasma] falconis TaxID=92403 RepID=A0A501XAQ8_9BACT|nr:hypothetical protein [[Mycoplasma] falconis]TPE57447.1 hypothetical protein FJO69_01695 [[Mycoplasma] falconis]
MNSVLGLIISFFVLGFLAMIYNWFVAITLFKKNLNKHFILPALILFGFLAGITIFMIWLASINTGADTASGIALLACSIIFLILVFALTAVFTVIYVLRLKGYTIKKVNKSKTATSQKSK